MSNDRLGVWMDAERGPIDIRPDMDPRDMWAVLQWALSEVSAATSKSA